MENPVNEDRMLQIIEDNFQLLEMSNRAQEGRFNTLSENFEKTSQLCHETARLSQETARLSQESAQVANAAAQAAGQNAKAISNILNALRGLGYSNAGIRQELEQLKLRVSALEEKAS